MLAAPTTYSTASLLSGVTIEETKERAILQSLVDRRPHPANIGFTQDAWTYDIVDEKTWSRMNAGGLPIPPKKISI